MPPPFLDPLLIMSFTLILKIAPSSKMFKLKALTTFVESGLAFSLRTVIVNDRRAAFIVVDGASNAGETDV
jgi:hypothetical protein